MNKQYVTVVALSVDAEVAVLYLHGGNTMTIRQGDPRLPKIVEACREPLRDKKQVVVDITEVMPERTEYSNAEKGTNGLVKFFRVAKKFVKDLINTESPDKADTYKNHVSPMELGTFPGQEVKVHTPEPVIESGPIPEPQMSNDEKLQYATDRLAQLNQIGKGTDTPEFHKPLDEAEESIVAINTVTGSVIPDAQKLAPQLRAASKLSDFTGFTRFVERLEHVIHDRGHSVEDLMKFIQHGDLPIADDGCIVIYKRLQRLTNGLLADVHTRRVKQKVGSYVFMKPGLVDPSRRRDCSNGLHVATLQYIRNFRGDVTVVAKVRPEDVFAVPEYDVTKMRVCGYHILVELPDDLRLLVNGGGSISSVPHGAELLNKILRGKHVGITQTVEIGGQHGSNLTIKDVEVTSADELDDTPVEVRNTTLDTTATMDPVVEDAAPIEAKSLVTEPVREVKPVKAGKSNKVEELANQFMYTNSPIERLKLATELVALKKKAKKGWAKLGLEHEGKLVEELVKTSPKPVTKAKVVTEITAPPVVKKSRAETAQAMFQEFWQEADGKQAKELARKLLDYKRIAKVSWDKLGITPEQVKHLEDAK